MTNAPDNFPRAGQAQGLVIEARQRQQDEVEEAADLVLRHGSAFLAERIRTLSLRGRDLFFIDWADFLSASGLQHTTLPVSRSACRGRLIMFLRDRGYYVEAKDEHLSRIMISWRESDTCPKRKIS